MTNQAKILRYLSSGQATSRAISDCYTLPLAVVDAICKQLVEEKRAASYQLGGHPEITVYRLTNHTNHNELLTRNPEKGAQSLPAVGTSPPPSREP